MMQELTGNLWDFWNGENLVVITTNGFVKANGEAVMGRGVALQAAKKWPWLPRSLGGKIQAEGNHVYYFTNHILSFPVKHNWWEQADLKLIQRSVGEMLDLVEDFKEPIYMPRPGCGNGGLDWADVKPLLERLDSRFNVVEWKR